MLERARHFLERQQAPGKYPPGVKPVSRTTSALKDGAAAPAPGMNVVPGDKTQIKVRVPSNGLFYEGRRGFFTLSPLTVGQIRSVHAAVSAGDKWTKESTFAAAIQKSVTDFDVLQMTIDDYRFLLYWIRFNSYKKSPYIVTWSHKTAEGTDKDVRSQITMTNLEVVECSPNKQVLDKRFAYPTVNDRLDYYKMDDESEKYIARYAQYLAGKDLREKIQTLEAMPAEILPDLKQHMVDFAHGVVETASLKDPDEGEAGDTYNVRLTFELSDFFP